MIYRIAVCLSGQARTWRACAPAIQSFFDIDCNPNWPQPHAVEVDYFLHTWDTDTWRRDGEMVDQPLSPTDIADLPRVFAAKKAVIEPLRPAVPCRPWDGLFYSFMRSIALKREYELEHHKEYDLVVKSRFDTIFAPGAKMPVHYLNPLFAYTSQPIAKFEREYFGNDFHDVTFYADSPTMDLIGDFYRDYVRECSQAMVNELHNTTNEQGCLRYGPGVMLYRHLTGLGIHPQCWTPFHAPITYTVVREEAVARGLDPIVDYEEVRKIYRAWY